MLNGTYKSFKDSLGIECSFERFWRKDSERGARTAPVFPQVAGRLPNPEEAFQEGGREA